ncbi:Bug family tripartite tricarboxylate transporter substrate binding protein [Massilia timonae]|uniref:Bug family tripartite tricarboxylate transporter substrate binding protein n=1 Tax=Massilia timonae TaxID=47229 RepID=UPI000ED57CA6|nr:tripartite tricarboxylate transporter substrate binding protein [Massilia timonae]HAK92740.1 LacI family transcriptional regulator [Massilia timonae]
MRMHTTVSSLLLGLALMGGAQAAPFPSKAITAVVPFPSGGSTDAIARAIGPKISATLGQPWVVDNRPGATGAIGAGYVKRAAPDGHTLMVASIAVYSVNPLLQKRLPYDPSKDFDLLTVAVQAPNVLVTNGTVPANTVGDFIAYLKKHPGKVTFATSGAGSSDHLTAALFWQKTGTSGLHVPYKGGAPAITDLLGGHANVSFQNINVVLGHIKSGKLRALAVTGANRSAALPNVPTLAESGVKDVDVYSWQAIAAPKGLPKDVKARLHTTIVNTLRDPQIKDKLSEQGFEIVASSPEQFAKFQAQELARWRDVITNGKIEID